MSLFPALFCLPLLTAAEVTADTSPLPSLAMVPGFQHWHQLLEQHQATEQRLRQHQSTLASPGIYDEESPVKIVSTNLESKIPSISYQLYEEETTNLRDETTSIMNQMEKILDGIEGKLLHFYFHNISFFQLNQTLSRKRFS